MLTSEDLLVVENNGTEPLELRYGGRATTIPAGSSKQVPFDAVRVTFGDPRSTAEGRIATLNDGTKVRIPSRPEELNRLDTLYGLGARKTAALQKGQDCTDTLADLAHPVTVSTLDGTPVDTVVSDPVGENPVAMPADASSPESIEAQLAQLQARTDALQAQLQESRQADASPADEEVTEDTPTKGGKAA